VKRLICAALASVSLLAAPPNPITWKLSDAPAKPVKAGARFTLQDPMLHLDVELYEGAAAFALPLKVAAGAAPGTNNSMPAAGHREGRDPGDHRRVAHALR
jgi:hypothetical protein